MAHRVCVPCVVLGVVFDGDDTLWSTEQLYDDARSRARYVVAQSGLDAARWEECERRIDVQNVANLGYSTERFPSSCVQAYEQLCRSMGRAVNAQTCVRVREAARSVFERDPPLVPGARETLMFLRAKGARLALLTKGDHELQLRRLQRSGLRDLFDVIRVVPEKSPAIIRDVVSALGVDVGCAWMVGNSIRSDVLPAIDAGLRAVWIDAHVWEYERNHDHVEIDGVIAASQLTDIPGLIAA
ncbi:MAG TPA: HAD family hydrolase [Terriglobales bacterium]|jgi:putative hydrolase of the HAD superfamily|nr:HAD family hydrolase [Terriglobales bacterium]